MTNCLMYDKLKIAKTGNIAILGVQEHNMYHFVTQRHICKFPVKPTCNYSQGEGVSLSIAQLAAPGSSKDGV